MSKNRFYPGYPLVVIDTVAEAVDANPVEGQCYLIAGRLYEAKLTGTAETTFNTVIAADNGLMYNETSAQASSGTAATNAGTAGTGVTASEVSSDGVNFVTTLTVSVTDALTLGDNVALSDGYLVYTFPAGVINVTSAYMTMGVTAASTEIQSDTPDVGIGTTVGSGANATLDAVDAAAENILTGQTAADTNGTATVKTVSNQVLTIESGDDHTVYFNVADTWADDTGADLTADIAGTITLTWIKVA